MNILKQLFRGRIIMLITIGHLIDLFFAGFGIGFIAHSLFSGFG